MEMQRAPRILVVDDDRKELDKTLETIRTHCASYEARVAVGAFEGLDYLFGRGRYHERRRHPLPDLVLLDVGMVPLDGMQVLRRIRDAEYLRHIVVALLCESPEERQRAMGQAIPAAAYVVKPISTDSLRGLLRMKREAAAAPEGAAHPA